MTTANTEFDVEEVAEALGQTEIAPLASDTNRRDPLPDGFGFGDDGEIVPIASPELDKCPGCARPYDEPESKPVPADSNSVMALIRSLIDAVSKQKTGRDIQLGRWVHMIAFYLGQLPACKTQADLAKYLGCRESELSDSKAKMPTHIRGLCRFTPKVRQPHCSE